MAIDNPLKPLDDAFRKLKQPVADFTRSLQGMVDPFLKVGTVMKDVLQPVLTGLLQPLQMLTGGLQTVTDRIRSFASSSLESMGNSLKSLGGTIGGMLPEKLRFAIDVVKTFGENVKDKAKDLAGPVGEKIGNFLDMVKRKAVGGTDEDGNKQSGYVSRVVNGASAILKAGGSVAQTFVELGFAMGQFVAKANPAAFARFQLAVDDLMAVIGQGLTPVFDTVTKLVRLAGDTFTTFSKTVGNAINTALKPVVGFFQLLFDVVGRVGQAVGRVMDRLAPSIAAVGDAINELFRATTPFVNFVIDFLTEGFAQAADIVGDAVKAAIPYVMAFAQVLGDVVSTLMRWTRELLAYVGIDIGEGGPGTKPGSSVGAAAKTATIGSVDSVIKAAQQAAFSLGTGSGSDPAKDTADHTKALVEKSEAIRKAIDSLPERMAVGIGTKLSEAMGFKKGRFESGLERIGLKDSPAAGIGSSLSAAALAAAAAFRSRADTGGSGTVSGAGGSF